MYYSSYLRVTGNKNNMKTEQYRDSYDDKMYIKYFFDKVNSFFLILILSVPFIAIILLIILEGIINRESKRSCFLSETRISHGRPFMIYKFNVAYPHSLNMKNPAGFIPIISCRNELLEGETYAVGKLTPLGDVLKKWYLDELPQLFNILAGHMTFVGPRPLPPALFDKALANGMIAKKILRAGVTGTVQMSKSCADLRNKDIYASLEIEYLRHIHYMNPFYIVFYDLYIIFKTFSVLLKGEGL